MSLSNDEMSVLMIAAQGQTMLPIGRWEEPTKSLATKGFMKCEIIAGGPQYTITEAGRAAMEKGDDDNIRGIIETTSEVGTMQKEARAGAEKAAQLLAKIAKLSASITGDTPETAARRWSTIVLNRALDIINNG